MKQILFRNIFSEMTPNVRSFLLCYCSPKLLLIKDKKLMVYLPAAPLRSFGEARPAGKVQSPVMFVQLGQVIASRAKLINAMSMRIYSEASIVAIVACLIFQFLYRDSEINHR